MSNYGHVKAVCPCGPCEMERREQAAARAAVAVPPAPATYSPPPGATHDALGARIRQHLPSEQESASMPNYQPQPGRVAGVAGVIPLSQGREAPTERPVVITSPWGSGPNSFFPERR